MFFTIFDDTWYIWQKKKILLFKYYLSKCSFFGNSMQVNTSVFFEDPGIRIIQVFLLGVNTSLLRKR